MADYREVVIKIKSESEVSTETGSSSISGSEISTISTSGSSETAKVDSKSTFVKATIINSAKELADLGLSEMELALNIYFKMTDNYQAQQQVAIAKNIVKKVERVGEAFATGGVVGGLIALAVVGIETAVANANLANEEYLKLTQQNEQLSFQRQRAGFSLTGGSIGENL